MPRLNHCLPKYSKHKASGQAVVTLSGTDCYLGIYGSAASRREYDRLIAEWIAGGRQHAADPQQITLAEIVSAYKKYTEGYYRRPDGTPTNEADRVVRELSPLRLFDGLPAVE